MADPPSPNDSSTTDWSFTEPSTWSYGWMAILVPNIVMLVNNARGGSTVIINAVVRSPLGAGGLLLMPPFFVAMEKCFYDTSLCLRAMDPNKDPQGRHGGGFPSGGHSLPSLSLVALRDTPLALDDIAPRWARAMFGMRDTR